METEYDDDYYSSRWSYDRLRTTQPHVETQGLWFYNDIYYIKCTDLSVMPLNEEMLSLEDYFVKKVKAMGTQMKLVEQVPEGAERIDDRSLQEVVQVVGTLLNQNDFDDQLALLIPPSFPPYRFGFEQGKGWILEVEKTISDSEYQSFLSSLTKLFAKPKNIIVEVNKNVSAKHQKIMTGLDLVPSRRSSFSVTPELKKLWENDEQLWVDQSVSVLSSNDFNESLLPRNWHKNGASCLLDLSISTSHDIRNYLTMYRTINIVVPLANFHERVLLSLNVSQEELVELVIMGRVKLLFPQNIERYNRKFLENLAGVAPNSLMFSRQLALRTIIDSRHRNPLLYPILETEDKQLLLAFLHNTALKVKDHNLQSWLKSLAFELSRIWEESTSTISFRGAMGTGQVGYAALIAAMIKSQTGQDYALELITSSTSVEWAGALNSTLCPVGDKTTITNTETLANMYSGVSTGRKMELMSSPNLATENILTIAKDVPVLELATAFKGADIDRFQNMIQRISQHQLPEEQNEIIEAFNKTVKSFERNKNRTNFWDIKGVLVDIGTTAASMTIPLAGLMMNIIGEALEYVGGSSKPVGDFLDKTQAKIYGSAPDAILVSRMKDQVKELL